MKSKDQLQSNNLSSLILQHVISQHVNG